MSGDYNEGNRSGPTFTSSPSDRLSTIPPASRASVVQKALFILKTKSKTTVKTKVSKITEQPIPRPKRAKRKTPPACLHQHTVIPRNAPSAEYLALARQRAEAQSGHTGSLDFAFGKEAASYLDAVPANLPGGLFFVDDAIRQCCAGLGLTRFPSDSPNDVDRYAHPKGFRTHCDETLPVVWMHNQNAPGIDHLRTGTHGFAWMFSVECARLHRAGLFHLLNSPGPEDQWKQRTWRYCGKYYAHRTGYTMSVDGWRSLSQSMRDTAASIRFAHLSASGHITSIEEVYAQFERGEVGAELVIFQFCGLPGYTFFDKLNEAAALSFRPAKPPGNPLNKLARDRIFARHPESVKDYMQIQQRMCSRRPVQA